VITRKVGTDHIWPERTCWIHGASSEVNPYDKSAVSLGKADKGKVPASSATNRAKPIPTGATNVALCFSTASIRIVNTTIVVKNISMNMPWVMDVPALSLV
jgi:hypothetical protein